MIPMPTTQRYSDMVWRIYVMALCRVLDEHKYGVSTYAAREMHDAMAEECIESMSAADDADGPPTVRM